MMPEIVCFKQGNLPMINSIIIGAAGGSGSGKTTFCKRLLKHFGKENVSILGQDSYYIDQSSKFDCDGGAVNFDHPSSPELPRKSIHPTHMFFFGRISNDQFKIH